MVVDNEFALRALVARGFRERGYDVLEVSDGLMALEVVGTASPAVDLVITNSLEPPLTGVDLIAQLQQLHPTLQVIHLLGGSSSADHWYDNTPPGGVPTVFKPFDLWALMDGAEKLLGDV
jgi:two-component system, response regulator, stage 0 sporulation protein F